LLASATDGPLLREMHVVSSVVEPSEVAAPFLDHRRWVGLAVLLVAIFVSSLDSFIVFVAVPNIRTDIGATFADTELIVAGYTFTAALGLIINGRLGDRFGRRTMFIIGFAAFTFASGLCGIAQSPASLIISRLLQGFAASVLLPQILALIRETFTEPRERATAFAWMGVVIGGGAIAGQIVGGLIIAADLWGLSWRPIFLLNLPIGACALMMAPLFITESRGTGTQRLDLMGAALSALGLGCLLYPLIEGREAGWPLWSQAMLVSAILIICLFGAHQHSKTQRKASPLIDTDLFHGRAFSVGLLLILLFYGTIGPLMLSFSYLAQISFKRSAMAAALDLAPLAVSFAVASIVAGKFTVYGARKVLTTGAIVVAVGSVLAYAVCKYPASPTPEDLILPLIVLGFGQGLFMTPLLNAVLSAIPEQHTGAASVVLVTMQRVGYALGVALLEFPFFSTLSHTRAAGAAETTAYIAAFESVILCIFFMMLVILALLGLLPSSPMPKKT
jgi:EmrB/QacA subfamily drug resistance transporter